MNYNVLNIFSSVAHKIATFFEQLVYPYQHYAFRATLGIMPFIWDCTKGLRLYIGAMAICSALIGAFDALIFGVLSQLIDQLSKIGPSDLWAECQDALILLFVLLVSSPAIMALQTLFKFQTLQGNFPMKLRWNFHHLMLNQSMSFFQDEFAGRISTKVTQTAMAVRDIVIILTDILVYFVIYLISVAAVLGSFNSVLLYPFLVWIVLYILISFCFIPRLNIVAKEQADARSLMVGRITDAYTNISTVKLFSHSQREAEYARSAMEEFMVPIHAQQRLVSAFDLSSHSINMGLILATLGTGLWLWTKGLVGIGEVAAAAAMALRINGISQWAMWQVADLFEHVGTVQDGIGIFSKPQKVRNLPNATSLEVPEGGVHFDKVCFSYSENKNILNQFSLHIRPGEKVGLIGRSGAGKSTIVNLLLRFYDIEDGSILIDTQDIRHVTQDSLRSQIGIVTQDTSLLHRSIRDNILYGRPDASEDEMIIAAIRAGADEFIATLTDSNGRTGYDAHVGERGLKLSGGQRQRIAIARTILKNAPILILDEATSALDSEIEAVIQNSLYNLMENKTVIAIAHRLSTIAAMDRLIVIEKGQIVEEGNHQTLLNKGGLYAQLWAHQSGGFLQ